MFNSNQHRNKRRPSFDFNNEAQQERKRARQEVHAMKKQLAFGDHYQLDPNAVGFIGVHVERDKAKIFTPATFKDIRSTLRNLRHHKEEEPFKSSVNILSRWCLKMGKEKFYVTRKKIVSQLNKNEILETNTANFGLIVERMYAVTFEISNNVPLQRFRQAGKWNHWVKKIPQDDKDLLAKYHSKLRRVPNSNARYFESKNNILSYLPPNSGPSKNSYLQEGLPSSTSVPIASNSARRTNFGLQEGIPSDSVPIASWPTSGNESKSVSNLWKENVDTRKHAWNIDLTTTSNSTTEKKKKVQQEGSNEKLHINNQQKDVSKSDIAVPIVPWPTSGNESKSGSNLWKENVDTRKHGWNNNDITTSTSNSTTEKKKKVQQEGSKEQVHINNEQKDASKSDIRTGPIASWPTIGKLTKKSGSNLWKENVDNGKHGWNNDISTNTTSGEKKIVQQDNEKSSDSVAHSVLALDDSIIDSDFNTIKRNRNNKNLEESVPGLKTFNEKLHEQLFECNIYWKREKGLPLSWMKNKGGSHVLQFNREDAKNGAIESTVRELRRMKLDEEAEDSDDDDDDDEDEDDEDERYDDDFEWEGCPYSNSKKKKESRYIDESSLRLVLSNIFDDNLVWDIGLQMLAYVGNGGATNCEIENGLWTNIYCPCSKMFKPWMKQRKLDDIICKPCKRSTFKEVNLFVNHVSSKASAGEDLVHVGIWHYINVMYKDYMKVSKGTAKKRKERIDNTKNVKG